jgi:hypothetical protein
VALLATALADPDANTTDLALDNNLSLARRNLVFGGGEVVGLSTARLFLAQGTNPFTRQDVAAVLPLVDLSNAGE